MSVVLLRNKKAAEYPLLPQSVYDDFADAEVSTITLPKGRWQVPQPESGATALFLTRSDVTVEASGCTFMVKPNPSTFLPIWIRSLSLTSPTYLPAFPGVLPLRTVSKLSGTVVPSTTTLTMHPDEVCDLSPGEGVLLQLGIDTSDPNEPQEYLPAVVDSVNVGTRVITFTAALGRTITNYVDAAGLIAAGVTVGQQNKIADWGELSDNNSYGRGYGTSHGMERFTGGMIHDITVNDLSMRIDRVPAFETGSYAFVSVVSEAAQRVTINRLNIHHPFGAVVHSVRSFALLVNDLVTTGFGRYRINQADGMAAVALSVYGGTDLTLRGARLRSTDINPVGMETNPRDVVIDDLEMDVAFTAVRSFPFSTTIFGTGATPTAAVFRNLRVHVTWTGGAQPLYFSNGAGPNQPVLTGALNFDGPLINTFDWTALTLSGTVILDGVTYGPAITTTFDRTVVHGAPSRVVTMPIGLYTSLTIQCIDAGDIREIDDLQFDYNDSLTSHAILPARAVQWTEIQAAGQAFDIDAYRASAFTCFLNNVGSTADGLLRFVATYLPEVV